MTHGCADYWVLQVLQKGCQASWSGGLNDLFRKKYETHQNALNLRNSETDLMLAKPKTEFLKRTFGYSGGTLWNNLPQELKLAESVSSFKRKIQQI